MSTLRLGVSLQPRWPHADATAALRAASHAEDLGFDHVAAGRPPHRPHPTDQPWNPSRRTSPPASSTAPCSQQPTSKLPEPAGPRAVKTGNPGTRMPTTVAYDADKCALLVGDGKFAPARCPRSDAAALRQASRAGRAGHLDPPWVLLSVVEPGLVTFRPPTLCSQASRRTAARAGPGRLAAGERE